LSVTKRNRSQNFERVDKFIYRQGERAVKLTERMLSMNIGHKRVNNWQLMKGRANYILKNEHDLRTNIKVNIHTSENYYGRFQGSML
jgi:hypothetical protein